LAHWGSPNTGATDESGFSGVPGGWRNFSSFANIRDIGFFWGAFMNTGSAYYRTLNYGNATFMKQYTFQSLAMSVRCIRTVADPPPTPVPCPGDTTFEYGGKTYHTVQIGEQCWMAENLDIGTMIPGNSAQSDNSVIEKYCYDDDPAKCSTDGGLYLWNEMMQYTISEGAQGICPSDWHLPTGAEWWILINYLGGESAAGGQMKESGTAHWFSPNTGATNESVFTALPAGQRNLSGNFNSRGGLGAFWSATLYYNDTGLAWAASLYNWTAAITWDWTWGTSSYGNSVRCIHN
jgi:uncharacterized protein (TIGR02145 family)